MARVFWSGPLSNDNEARISIRPTQDLPEEVLAPVMAGAYVRGIADTFDAVGLACAFLDRNSRVLVANAAAERFLRGPLQVAADHLLAETTEDNRLIAEVVAAAMNGPQGTLRSVRLPAARLDLHCLSFGDPLMPSGQMVRAIVVIDDGDDPVLRAVVDRLAQATPGAGRFGSP